MLLKGAYSISHISPLWLALGGGGASHMKGMLFVSLRGANLGFWSRSGCSGQNAMIMFSREGLF